MLNCKRCCRVCSRGLYSCQWSHLSRDGQKGVQKRFACCWFSVVCLVTLLSLSWMYICLVTFNDQEDVNWQGFTKLKRWVNWFIVLIITSAVITSYCVLLLLFALFHVALREPLNLHWLHKGLLCFGVLFILVGVIGISLEWRQEWPTIPLSLQATAPFLHLGGVGALTLLSSFVFQGFHMAKKRSSKVLIAAVFVGVASVIFLCPLLIQSPCLIEWHELPEKPKLIGHRGAPMLAPENTMMSFNKSIECGVSAFETDLQLSKDRIPFLMHDHHSGFLRRTTDVMDKFPKADFSYSSNVTWEELQSLNAGQWFLQTDPFLTVSLLSEEDRETAGNQTIPSLLELLHLAQRHNISVIFDLYSPNQENDTIDTVHTILKSGIDPSLILWLPPVERDYVNITAPGFIHIFKNESEMFEKGGNHLNLKYSKIDTARIRELRSRNVTVNMWVVNERWLFSLLWCAGVSSVTTNACHLLRDQDRPDWVMAHRTYIYIWITVDILSILIIIGIFFLQQKSHRFHDKQGLKNKRSNAFNLHEKELYLPVPTG